jgi:hypothetical protein
MRPWMLKGLQRERRKLERERLRRSEQRLSLTTSVPQAQENWQTSESSTAESADLGMLRGVWITEI